MGDKIHLIGDYNLDGVSEVSALFCRNPTPSLSVVDVRTGTVIGSTTAPAGQSGSYTDFPRDPTGKQHPFLANSWGAEGAGDTPAWVNICIFRPDRVSSPECGPGFSKANQVPVMPIHSIARQTGGYLQDIDGDGWEDISLLYEWITLTISPNTLTVISQTEFDVAQHEPDAYLQFHAGRQYGTHAAVKSVDGMLRDVIIGGSPLGGFPDPSCNVSRFVGVLESSPGAPASRRLKWSKYYGFQSASFSTWDPNVPFAVMRQPDVENGCIHRFDDSRSTMGGAEVLVFNLFRQIAPVSTCIAEQLAYYGGDSAAWYGCQWRNLKTTGIWEMQVLRESDGTPLTGSRNTYVWGWLTGMIPGGEPVYLTEMLPGSVPFDRSDRAPAVIEARALSADGSWQGIWSFPVAERPVVSRILPAGNRGAASYTGYSHLRTTDYDHDGLLDVQLVDGAWIGYSRSLGLLEVKGALAVTPVVWTAPAGVNVAGNTLTKTAADGWGNASAASTLVITSGDGYIEFTATETDSSRAAGLAVGNANQDIANLIFGLSLASDGTVSVFERGVNLGRWGTYAPGDVFRVGVFGGIGLYFRNGVVLLKSDSRPVYPLHFGATLNSAGSTITNARIARDLSTSPPITLASLALTVDRSSPQQARTPITFSATAAGGVTPYQFKWWFFNGSQWTVARDWSTSSSYTWVPATARANYSWAVYGRSAGNTADAFELVASTPFSIQRPPRPVGLATRGDLDGTGTADVVWRDTVSGTNTLWMMDALSQPAVSSLSTVADLNWEIKGVADFNGDAKADILWRNKATGQNALWFMDGSMLLGGRGLSGMSDLNWDIKGVGDLNADGKADILWRNRVTGANVVWLMDDGAILAQGALFSVDTSWDVEGVGDFNRDGKADLFWRRATGENAIWLLDGLSVVDAGYVFSVDPNWEVRGIGDVDGDGKADVVWRHTTMGLNSLWLMNGMALASGGYLPTVADLNWEIRGTGDFDGDGKVDLFWRNKATGQNSLWLLDGFNLLLGGYTTSMGLTADPVSPRK